MNGSRRISTANLSLKKREAECYLYLVELFRKREQRLMVGKRRRKERMKRGSLVEEGTEQLELRSEGCRGVIWGLRAM